MASHRVRQLWRCVELLAILVIAAACHSPAEPTADQPDSQAPAVAGAPLEPAGPLAAEPPAPAPENPPPPAPPPPPDTAILLEDEVLVLVNQRRAAGATCGGTAYGAAPPLGMQSNLRLAARDHSHDMAGQNYFSHTSLDGRTFDERIRQAGYAGSAPLGENIAGGPVSASSAVILWMSSPGHCANIMSRGFRVIGVGYANHPTATYRHYWTQTFGGG